MERYVDLSLFAHVILFQP